ELIQFIDGLNIAIAANPPLRVVDIAGKGLGFVPHHWAMIASATMQIVAQIGIRILSKTETDRYLRAANLNLFNPKGLSVRICTTAGMLALVKPTEEQKRTKSEKAKAAWNKLGRGVGTVLLKVPMPITSMIVNAFADPPPTNQLLLNRRFQIIDGHALPLEIDLGPPIKKGPFGPIKTAKSWDIKFTQYWAGRTEKKNEKNRRRLDGDDTGLSSLEEWWHRRDQNRAQIKAQIPILGPALGKTRKERRVNDANLLDHWAIDEILWLVVMNSEKDQEISGIEIAESAENEERVQEGDWQNIMRQEEQ
ncbi:hypothetical protein C8J56DRAFT_752901, partial [Mycena floridula]